MSGASGHAHYKATKTVIGPDGKKHTETIDVYGDDAVNLMRDMRSDRNNTPDLDRFGFRPLINPSNYPGLEHRIARNIPSPRGEAASSSSSSKSSKHIATPQRPTASQNTKEFLEDALKTHNELRRRHGVGPLRLSNDLSKLAQKWADHLASTGALVHSTTKYRNVNVGENLRCQSWAITGKEMTESWYNECTKYDYRNPSYQPGTGHFTQVVWKGSEEVGFAWAQGNSMIFAVAMYYPPGNYVGDFDRNVFPPR